MAGVVRVTQVAMKSTSVYWIPAYETLERAGFEVILVPPRMTKQIGGRKSDVLGLPDPLHGDRRPGIRRAGHRSLRKAAPSTESSLISAARPANFGRQLVPAPHNTETKKQPSSAAQAPVTQERGGA